MCLLMRQSIKIGINFFLFDFLDAFYPYQRNKRYRRMSLTADFQIKYEYANAAETVNRKKK